MPPIIPEIYIRMGYYDRILSQYVSSMKCKLYNWDSDVDCSEELDNVKEDKAR